jgi:ferric-dicitrate binding protein FerR (iron transport regulator)
MPPRYAVPILVLLLVLARPARADEPFGRVVARDGAALVLRAARRQTVTEGFELLVGDELRTGADGRVVVESPGGLRIVVGPAAELKLKRRLVERERSRIDVALDLLTGVLRLLGAEGGAPQSLSVETRAAVASVRSTEWLVQATGVDTAVLSLAGTVEVRAAGATVALNDGQGTDVLLGGQPRPPAPWGQARRDRLLALVPF